MIRQDNDKDYLILKRIWFRISKQKLSTNTQLWIKTENVFAYLHKCAFLSDWIYFILLNCEFNDSVSCSSHLSSYFHISRLLSIGPIDIFHSLTGMPIYRIGSNWYKLSMIVFFFVVLQINVNLWMNIYYWHCKVIK